MANRYFNKQTTNARQALAQGGPAKLGQRVDPRKRSGGPKMGRPSLGDKIKPDPKKPSPKLMELLKKRKQERDQKRMKNSKPESAERKKRQADYMKKHGENAPRRKTLSVKNRYKKEVEGLK
jgi:hypothetical protein